MKTPLLIPLLTLVAALTAQAQTPGGPPPPPPGVTGTMTLNQSGPPSEDRERAMHLGEAIKHLQAAGLGEMAQHIEQMLQHQQQQQQQQQKGRPGSSGPGASGGLPPGQFHLQTPQPRRPSGPPQSFNRPMPWGPGGPGAGPDSGPRRTPNPRMRSGDNDELRAQVQRLAREVEELRRQVNNRMNEHRQGGPRDGDKRDGDRRDGDRRDGDKRDGEHREGRPGPRDGDHPEHRPQGGRSDAKPQGDQTPPRPPSDGPRREHRDSPPEPKRDGAEEVKPALVPGSDSIE